ncbi:MAG: phosphoglycerate mutase [Lysobacteraceae bacterium]
MLTLLLAARRHFAELLPSPAVAKALGRAAAVDAEVGELAQLRRPFRLRPAGQWPSAALMERRLKPESDVQPFQWLRADPVWLQPDLTTARLMAWGNLGLTAEDAAALMAPLKPLFGDFGYVFESREAEAWSVQCPRETRLPSFRHPLAALGDDAFPYLPEGPDAPRWRSLMGEAQVLMHQHPVNAERARRGLPPANSLWFWGEGGLPDQVEGPIGHVATADPELAAYATAAGASVSDRVDATKPGLIDLRAERRWPVIDDLLALALAAMGQGAFATVRLDFADGHLVTIEPAQRWRFWKPAFKGFA